MKKLITKLNNGGSDMEVEVTISRQEVTEAITQYMKSKGYTIRSIDYRIERDYYGPVSELDSVKMKVENKEDKK